MWFRGNREIFYLRFGICLILGRKIVLFEICATNTSLQNRSKTLKKTSLQVIKLFTFIFFVCLFNSEIVVKIDHISMLGNYIKKSV